MTTVVACLPSWYIASWIRGEESFFDSLCAWMLAILKLIVRTALWPVDITWRVLMASDTLLFELMAIGAEMLFLLWLWIGSGHPLDVVLKTWPRPAWTIILLVVIIDHIYCLRTRDRDLRALALLPDLAGYVWLLFVLRSQLCLVEVFLWVFALAGVIAVLSLRSSSSQEHHGNPE